MIFILTSTAVIDFSSEIIVVIDSTKHVVQVNNPFEKYTGIKADIVLGKNIKELALLDCFDNAQVKLIIKHINTALFGKEWFGKR